MNSVLMVLPEEDAWNSLNENGPVFFGVFPLRPERQSVG